MTEAEAALVLTQIEGAATAAGLVSGAVIGIWLALAMYRVIRRTLS